MGKPSDRLLQFMKAKRVDHDEVWEVRPNSGNFAIKHSALERVAAENGITFELPQIIERDALQKNAALLVVANMGDRREWSIGEASPANNKNAYVYSMAEKRGKDRCILKLLNAHGPGMLYSEEELDEAPKRQNPHVTRVADVYDEISEDIPAADVPKMRVKDARPAYTALINEMQRIQDPQELYDWGQSKANEIHALSGEWPQHFKGEYTKHKKSIINGKAA